MFRTVATTALLALAFSAVGCSHKVELFCDESTPCTDPARPFCDLNGQYEASDFVSNTCIPDPFGGADASVADAMPADAGAGGFTVVRDGNGSGTVISDPFGINCGSICSTVFASGTDVQLTAVSDTGSTFVGWTGGGCSGTGDCVTTYQGDTLVRAEFALERHALEVTRGGDGTGNVTTDDSAIDCGLDCSETYDYGAMVTLTATATGQSTFGGWSGACSGLGATCTVDMDQARSVGAAFDLNQVSLSVGFSGSGGGTVTADTGPIDCPGTCSASYGAGTTVTLSATPDGTSTFASWSGGGCSGTGDCVVTLNAAASVTATFVRVTHALTVQKSGTGMGLVTSNPSGINCGSTCMASYTAGSSVALTATPSGSDVFTGWSGAGCSGTGSCIASMSQARTVTADFCRPLTCAADQCETISNGCGGTVDCGDCTGNWEMCGAAMANICSSTNTHSLTLPASAYAQISDQDQETNGGVLDLDATFTLELWLKLTADASRPLLGKFNAVSLAGYLLSYAANTHELTVRLNDGSAGATTAWAFTPTLDVWTHLAVACDLSRPAATRCELFINAASAGNGSSIGSVASIYDNIGPFSLTGPAMDDVRVWSDVRTPAEIAAGLYQELQGNEANLLGYWKLNNNFQDASPYGNDLTPANSPSFTTDTP